MAKAENKDLEVHLRNDWYNGGRLLRSTNNPHFVPEAFLDEIPTSAKVKVGNDLVSVEELRGEKSSEKKADLKI